MIDKAVAGYLSTRKILILDKSSAARQALEKAALALGAEKYLITTMKSFPHARDYIRISKPEIIITDFQIHDDYGLDLMALQEDYIKNPLDRVFMVVTENSNDSAVADAAEEEVDGYLLKPFSQESAQAYLHKILNHKIHPSEYLQLITKGKRFLELQKWEEAEAYFEKAAKSSPKPSLALYYVGQCYHQQNQLALARNFYSEALSYHALHFKSLVSHFHVTLEIGDTQAAYKELLHIAKHYPLSPHLLEQAFILCVKEFKYRDVEYYYERYLKLDRKTDELKMACSQALLSSGRDLLKKSFTDEALNYFLKGAVISSRSAAFLNQVVDSLLEFDLLPAAEKYISLFEAEEINSSLYKQLLFKITSHKSSYDKVIEEGKSLIYDGHATPEIYIKVFELLENTQMKPLLENLIYKAIDQFPEHKTEFSRFFPKS